MSDTKHWEYKLVILRGEVSAHDKLITQDLTELGKSGWEVVAAWPQETRFAGMPLREVVLLSKRPLSP